MEGADTARTGADLTPGAVAAFEQSLRRSVLPLLPTTCHAGRWSRFTGVVVTEDYDARGICRRFVLRTGLAAVAAVASGCTDIPPTRPRPPGMRITGGDGFGGPYAAGTYTIARGGAYGPTEIGYRSNDPNATGAESGPTSVGAPLCVTTIETATIEGVHLKSTVLVSYALCQGRR